MSLFLNHAPSRETRERIGKIVMLGFVLPLGILLVLQSTRFALFPGRTRILLGALEVAVFGFLALNSIWTLTDRRAKQANTR
jgi:hypothetical protein